jgi:hypothetical protein
MWLFSTTVKPRFIVFAGRFEKKYGYGKTIDACDYIYIYIYKKFFRDHIKRHILER